MSVLANTSLKFVNLATYASLPSAASHAGTICFVKDKHSIYVSNGTDWVSYAGILDANYNAETTVLTLTKGDGTNVSLDFSNVASKSELDSKLNGVKVNGTFVGGTKDNQYGYCIPISDGDNAGDVAVGKFKVGTKEVTVKGANKTVTIETPALTEPDSNTIAKKYVIKQGGSQIGVIDIPKDLVVSAGDVRKLSDEEAATKADLNTTDLYIVLTIANSTSDKVYIPVQELVDVYTSGSVQADDVQIVIEDNQIKATLHGDLKNKINAARVDSIGGKTGAITLKGDNEANGSVNLTINDSNVISASINNLGGFVDDKINLLDSSKSGESNGINVKVDQVDGKINAVTVTALDFQTLANTHAETYANSLFVWSDFS